jgi:hypothetical protein
VIFEAKYGKPILFNTQTKVLSYVPQSVNDLESWVVDGEVVDLKNVCIQALILLFRVLW